MILEMFIQVTSSWDPLTAISNIAGCCSLICSLNSSILSLQLQQKEG